MSGKSPGLIWCSRCSCEYLTRLFYFGIWLNSFICFDGVNLLCSCCSCACLEVCFTLDQNNPLRCWSCIWKNHGKVFLYAPFVHTISSQLSRLHRLQIFDGWAEFNLQGIQTLDELLLFLLLSEHAWHVLLQAGDDVGMHLNDTLGLREFFGEN